MPMPWLKNKNKLQSGVTVEYRKPDIKPNQEMNEDNGLEAGAQDLINAIEARDKKLVLSAIRSIFEILESMPHDENNEPSSDESEKE